MQKKKNAILLSWNWAKQTEITEDFSDKHLAGWKKQVQSSRLRNESTKQKDHITWTTKAAVVAGSLIASVDQPGTAVSWQVIVTLNGDEQVSVPMFADVLWQGAAAAAVQFGVQPFVKVIHKWCLGSDVPSQVCAVFWTMLI